MNLTPNTVIKCHTCKRITRNWNLTGKLLECDSCYELKENCKFTQFIPSRQDLVGRHIVDSNFNLSVSHPENAYAVNPLYRDYFWQYYEQP